ncbi:MAG: M48 family metalloprotease [Bernardetiaceae bacterium]|nr:M48 family metalloprotease [Bernardetiaceae bacterium]
MKKIALYYLVPFFWLMLLSIGVTSCSKDGTLNVFSLQDDIELGQKVAAQIENDPNIIVLDPAQYPVAYSHLNRITNNILNSGKVRYRNEFPWRVRIIQDEVLNAFCAPGGYIYVYTGLIRYLNTEDEFAGVMAHEIAHADKRHVTNNLTRAYGIETLAAILLGDNPGALGEIASGLVNLSFSRSAEREADEYSVIYLCETEYQANGAAGFFELLLSSGQAGRTPEFLSTHPSPDNRVEDINAEARNRSCSLIPSGNPYQELKNSLP